MGNEATQFRNKTAPYSPRAARGLAAYYDNGLNRGGQQYAYHVISGDGQTTQVVADVSPTQAANVTLIPDDAVPSGMKCYVRSFKIGMLGVIPWSATAPVGALSASLQDSAGNPGIVIPANAFKGMSNYALPDNQSVIPLLLGESTITGPVGAPPVTFTYSASAGVATLTASAAVFISSAAGANGMIGVPISIVDGTGKGQTAFITASTTTVLTFPAFATAPADHASSAKDSVIAVWWQPVKTATSTTVSVLENGGGTGYTANAFDQNFSMLVVDGLGKGQARPIIASTTAAGLTLSGALSTNVDAALTSLVMVTNCPNMSGIVDLIGNPNWGQASGINPFAVNKGLVMAVNLQGATLPLGSNFRVELEVIFGMP